MATVTLADGSRAEVTPDNWQEMSQRQIGLKGNLNFQEKSATIDAFKQLAGLGNGFYRVTPGGAASPLDMGEKQVLSQPLVRLSDRLMGNVNPESKGIWRDLSDSGVELAGNARDLAKHVADALPNPPGGLPLWLVAGAVVAGCVLVYVASR